jgi:hypothetical protein
MKVSRTSFQPNQTYFRNKDAIHLEQREGNDVSTSSQHLSGVLKKRHLEIWRPFAAHVNACLAFFLAEGQRHRVQNRDQGLPRAGYLPAAFVARRSRPSKEAC